MAAFGPRVALDLDEAAARVAAEHLGWSKEKTEKEVADFRGYVRRLIPEPLQRI